MRHLTLLPFLIAAVLVMPRAHAAVASGMDGEPSSYGAALICLVLVLLAKGPARTETFNLKHDKA